MFATQKKQIQRLFERHCVDNVEDLTRWKSGKKNVRRISSMRQRYEVNLFRINKQKKWLEY